MMTEKGQEQLNVNEQDLFAERTEFEAALAAMRPNVRPDSLLNTQKEGLLLLCRSKKTPAKAEFDLHLAQTIVQTGREEITLSLRQYIRSVRNSAFLFGLLLGVLIGGALLFAINEHARQTQIVQKSVKKENGLYVPLNFYSGLQGIDCPKNNDSL